MHGIGYELAAASFSARCSASSDGRGRGHDHATVGLGDDVLGDVPHEVLQRAAAAPQARPAADARGLLGGEHDRLHAATAGLLDDRVPGAPRPDGGGGDLHARVLLPHDLRARERLARVLDLRFGQARFERQRHRDHEHPHGLDRGGVDRGLVGLFT